MASTTDTKNLSLALRLVGLIFVVGIYPLTILWPSGWSWVPAQPMYLQMILGIYATLGIFLFLAAKDPMKHLSLDLVYCLVQLRPRGHHGLPGAHHRRQQRAHHG